MSKDSEGEKGDGPNDDKKDVVIVVAPNGLRENEPFHPHQTVGHLLAAAVKDFAKKGALDGAALYDLVKDATPLNESLTLDAAHVRPGDVLKIRSRAIPVDGSCIRS
jgi:hypothetical protein